MNFNTKTKETSSIKKVIKNFIKNITFMRNLVTLQKHYTQLNDPSTCEDEFSCDSLDKFFDNFELPEDEINDHNNFNKFNK